MKKSMKNSIIKKIVSYVLVMATVVATFSGMAPMAVAEAAAVKSVTSVNHNAIKLSEDKLYGFVNASSGYAMNTKHGGKSNGSAITVYPQDYTNTQLYSVTVVSEKEKTFRLSPCYDDTKYLDVRRYGAPLAEGQSIVLWEEDHDPLRLKDLQLELNPDGSVTLVLAVRPDLCIGLSSSSAAATRQKQLTVVKKTGALHERWLLTDEKGNILNLEPEKTSQYAMQLAFNEYMTRFKELGSDVNKAVADTEYQDAVTRWRLAQIVNKFSGEYQYFTVSGKPCYSNHRESSHSCDKCKNVNVLNQDWLKDLFGLDKNMKWTSKTVEKFLPNQVGTATGWSCWGFGNFCQYALFKNSNQDTVEVGSTVKGKFNRTFIEKNARVGDIIRVNGHSVVVFETTAAGMFVVDCNWSTTPVLNKTALQCKVQLHFLSYNHSYYANKECYVVSIEEEQKMEMIENFTSGVRVYAPYF